MYANALTQSSVIRHATPRASLAAASAVGGLALIALGSALPWLTLFRGLQAQPGFLLDGGKLAGVAIASAGLLLVAARIGGGRILRALAIVGSAGIMFDSLLVASRIAAYVADPGPAGPLTQPTTGPGPLVMAIGGAFLLIAAVSAPLAVRRLTRTDVTRLVLGGVLFAAGWIHLLLTPEHLNESTILGSGFFVAGIVQVVLAALVVARPRDSILYLIVATNVALIAIYANAVMIGLPFGAGEHQAAGLVLGTGEPVDIFGALTTIAQVAGFLVAVILLGRSTPAHDRASDRADA